MPAKIDPDATTGSKLLRLFQRLIADQRRHFQSELAEWLHCSKQTVIRLIREIEGVTGSQLLTGIDGHRRWYQLKSRACTPLGIDCEVLRFLQICREMAHPYLPEQIQQRVDDSMLRFAMLLADSSNIENLHVRSGFSFCSKGRIDYTPHFMHINLLMRAQEEHHICLVHYQASGHAKEKEHRFVVSRMVCMNNAIYALGASVDKDFTTMRHLMNLAVHRIQSVRITDHPVPFTIPEASLGLFGLPWHEPRTFRIRFLPGKAANYVRERIWADRQTLEEQDDGGVILEITTCSEPELMAWVRSFGENAILLPPVSSVIAPTEN